MTPKEGIAKLCKLLGSKAGYRESRERTSPEAREIAREKSLRFKALYDTAKDKRDARQRELLADPTFQQFTAEARELRKQWEQAQADCLHFRLTVGTNEGWAFFVQAHGDNWADVIKKLEQSKERAENL